MVLILQMWTKCSEELVIKNAKDLNPNEFVSEIQLKKSMIVINFGRESPQIWLPCSFYSLSLRSLNFIDASSWHHQKCPSYIFVPSLPRMLKLMKREKLKKWHETTGLLDLATLLSEKSAAGAVAFHGKMKGLRWKFPCQIYFSEMKVW